MVSLPPHDPPHFAPSAVPGALLPLIRSAVVTPGMFSSVAVVADSIGGSGTATINRPHWTTVWAALARQQFHFKLNAAASNVPYFGTSGIRADQAITDWLPAALASGAEAIVFEPGTNNYDVSGGTTAQAVADQKAAAADAIHAAGKVPIIFDILPVRSDAPTAAARVAWEMDANAKTALKMAQRPWARYVTWSEAIAVDGSGYVATSTDYGDYLHPQMDGHFKLGAYVHAATSDLVTPMDFFSTVSFVSPNPTRTGAAPGTGWALDKGTGKGSSTESMVARGGSLGNWHQVNMVGTAANATRVSYGFGTASGGWVVGDVVALALEFETDPDVSALHVMSPKAYTLIGGDFSARAYAFQGGNEPTNASFVRMPSGILLSPWFTIGVGTTQVAPWVDMPGTGGVRTGRFGFVKRNP